MTSQTNPEAAALGVLADRCEAATGADNALDVLIEIALFKPDAEFTAIRANAVGTKVIYTKADGREVTHWAGDWTMDRSGTAAALRSRIASLAQGGVSPDTPTGDGG